MYNNANALFLNYVTLKEIWIFKESDLGMVLFSDVES